MKEIKAALVGCGVIAPNHLNALSKIEGVNIVALCDIQPEKAEALKQKFSLDAAVYTDYEKMLDETTPDVLHVCTPHYLHSPMAEAALKRNISVFLEKPLVMKAEEIPSLIACEKQSEGKVCVCFQNRFNRSTELAKEMIVEDGGVLSAYATVIWDRGTNYYHSGTWRGKRATEGGGVLINQAIHSIDLLNFILGTPKKLEATVANHHLKGMIDVEDTAEAYITYENGKTACLYATTALVGDDVTSVLFRTKNRRIEIRGTKLLVDDEIVYNEAVDAIGKVCYGNGHEKLIALFYDALQSGKEPPVSAESAQYALRILLAAYRSNGKEVEI